MSLRPLTPLAEALGGQPVAFAADCAGPAAAAAVDGLPMASRAVGELALSPGERRPGFAALAALAIFTSMTRFAAHRAHASTDGLARRLPAASAANAGRVGRPRPCPWRPPAR